MPIKLVELSVWPEDSTVANCQSGLLAVASTCSCHSPEKEMLLCLGRMPSVDLLLHQMHGWTTIRLV